MHIVLLFTFDYSLQTWVQSGHLQRELKFYKSLINKGFKFTFVTYGDEKDLNILDGSDIQVFPIYTFIKKNRFKVINILKSFYIPFLIKKKFLNKSKKTLIKQNQLLGSWVAIILKLITNSKLYTRTGYDMYLFSKNNNKSFLKQIMFYFLTQITLIFSDQYSVTSKADLEFLNKNYLYKNKILLRPNWVEVNLARSGSKENNKILAVGRLEEQKNFKELIREVKDTDFEIDIYGEGAQKDSLLKLASELKVPLQIFNFINNDDLLLIYQQYKYFVSTANFEGNSKVILEAMASGCVVIAKDINNNRELIDDKKSGLLFNGNLNEILINCQKNNYELEEIANNAKNKVMKNFSLSQISNSYADDFYSLLKTN
tara:strand:- start:60 stop:1175 length:1116 start_codon:yes stop_codon:yes gene_type:complete